MLSHWISTNLDYLLFAGCWIAIFAAKDFWLHKKGQPILPLNWIIAVAALVLGAFFLSSATHREQARVQNLIAGMAPTYATELERLGHAEISEKTAPDDERYLAMVDAEI